MKTSRVNCTALDPALYVAVILLLAFTPRGASAVQASDSSSVGSAVAVLSANALVGALTGAASAALNGSDISRAFVRGFAGGALNYAGKRVAVSSGTLAPIVGRSIHSVGSSLIAQAADTSRAMIGWVEVPIGPMSFRLSNDNRPSARLNAYAVWVLGDALTRSDLRIDWTRSARVLSPVFLTTRSKIRRRDEPVAGIQYGRLIVIDGSGPTVSEKTFRHEAIHLLQEDFYQLAWGCPLERSIWRAVPGGHVMPRWLSLGVALPALGGMEDSLRDGDGRLRTIIEEEAHWFDKRYRH